MPQWGGGNRCSRCDKSVYTADEIIAAGKSWHKLCFSCESCSKRLDSTTVSDKEGKIYCKGCYGKHFGPKGYGYGGGAGALTNTD
ncbi:cysteine and glycine-rich protein 2-like [Lytechinus pictus]|uniref:cysteine and glycine-rich protein 2-like n=1 Tax=Lytechinus pictus TaxID=7653 RepID=UPI0030B9E2EB